MSLLINQSLIKKFFNRGEKRDYCPYSIYCESIKQSHKRTTTSMDAGSYFETLCLGGGAAGSMTHDMPRKKLTSKQIIAGQKIGDKTIDQIRIEQQQLIFEKQKSIYQINVQEKVNTQIKLYKQWSKNDDVILHGEFDIFPTTILLPERGLKLCTIDLKLTGRFSDYGEYCWATPEAMDHIQGLMYHELGREIDIELNQHINPDGRIQDIYTGPIKRQIETNDLLFFYWIFNYKDKELHNKFVEVVWNATKKAELNESIRRTVEEINKNERNGWEQRISTYENCSKCPVLECQLRVSFNKETQPQSTFDAV